MNLSEWSVVRGFFRAVIGLLEFEKVCPAFLYRHPAANPKLRVVWISHVLKKEKWYIAFNNYREITTGVCNNASLAALVLQPSELWQLGWLSTHNRN